MKRLKQMIGNTICALVAAAMFSGPVAADDKKDWNYTPQKCGFSVYKGDERTMLESKNAIGIDYHVTSGSNSLVLELKDPVKGRVSITAREVNEGGATTYAADSIYNYTNNRSCQRNTGLKKEQCTDDQLRRAQKRVLEHIDVLLEYKRQWEQDHSEKNCQDVMGGW